ncbi:MAG: bifunctional 4-hydroxy-2-oxoglutarate aldolase/2-dehydro-3-deoxy-phosphogluconate aldolase [Defluviitaleaceae bacterium]|nr:bifunctional 4-hydroxy-2-oxoglutarate aldolase/2-dehydro-3-deoxy-phosphogluconate aldolase [Defluviitaleaceae bacterium]
MQPIFETIRETGVVPVIRLDDASRAAALANALKTGGLPVAEVTFRTAAAEESIRRMCGEAPDVLVGAGTVVSAEQVDRAHGAGAKFVVSPGFSAQVVNRCQELGLPVIPGCVTPSEIMAALSMGLTILKFFPAENYGGLKAIKALSPVFPQVRFIPTGGVNAENLAEYLNYPAIYACGGSWMVRPDLDETANLCAKARNIVREAGR